MLYEILCLSLFAKLEESKEISELESLKAWCASSYVTCLVIVV